MDQNKPTVDRIEYRIHLSLEETVYSCWKLTKLSGGIANYVYRGTLNEPLPDGTKTVVFKHTAAYSASSTGFKLPVERALFEQTIVRSLKTLPSFKNEDIHISTPHLYHSTPIHLDQSTQIYADLCPSLDLKTYVLNHHFSLTQSQCASLGHAIGRWLKTFHVWGKDEKQHKLVEEMKGNKEMKKLKYRINYEMLIATIPNFEGILGGEKERKCVEEVRAIAKKESEMEDGAGLQLIHGDFWSGNILVSTSTSASDAQSKFEPGQSQTHILVLDWELSHIASPAYDLGQMLAELFCLYHFKSLPAGLWLMESFIHGYRSSTTTTNQSPTSANPSNTSSSNTDLKMKTELALKTAIHAGVHLICWGSRVLNWGTPEQVTDIVRIGRNWVVDGHAGDVGAFAGGPLGMLFD